MGEMRSVGFALIILMICSLSLSGQSNRGEIRLKVTDPTGLGLKSTVEIASEANQLRQRFLTDTAGNLVVRGIPFGVYTVVVEREGFSPYSGLLEVRSAVPSEQHVTLSIGSVSTSVTVNSAETLIDPHASGTVYRIGSSAIEDRISSFPGRSLQDLVNSQPGWLYEGNAVLHPRGSEYQTQFVVNGIPLTDNRSPSFGPEIEAQSVQSMSIYTAGIPAEYGRKMGGVVEVNTVQDFRKGLHGELNLSSGSFDTAGTFGMVQYGWGKNNLGVSAGGNMTDRYLNPPVIQNYTNTGTTGEFAADFERDLTDRDSLSLQVRHGLSRFLVPNERIQEHAGQRQDRNNFETMGVIAYQHTFSPDVLGDFRAMVRDDSEGLSSSPLSTPIIAFQSNGFREGYFKAMVSIHHGKQEWKAGIESDATFLHEQFSDVITDVSQFGPGTPATFRFLGSRPDLEQSAFIEDLVDFGQWTVSAGLRWDHYQLLANQNAVSPRLSVSRYIKSADMVLHASYDRVFQTPDFENILLASSAAVTSLSPEVLRLPVEPSHGNYYEVGVTKGFFQKLRLDANYFERLVSQFADDDQLLDTAVSFPTAFNRAKIYGAEGKLDLPRWWKFSGFVSYSYMVGSAYLPITGGLFLGDDAAHVLSQRNGRLWVTQDQRNTVRTRFRYQVVPRIWLALGAEYGSGLPFEFTGTQQQAIAQFGQAIVNRVDFSRGRVRPSLALDGSLGADLFTKDKVSMRLQADVENITNRLNLIDFSGLFSGNTIAPPRSYALRLVTSF
jgi:hypothetical protein